MTSKTKLNLGSGKDYRPDHLNVDLRDNVGADLVANIRDLEFPDEQFTEIYAKDILDMISHADAKRVLHNCYRWLKPNGNIQIHLPNLTYLAQLLVTSNGDGAYEALRWLYGSDGEIGERERREQYGDIKWKRWAYTMKSLTRMLEDIGFIIVHRSVTCGGFGIYVIAVKR